MTTIDKFADTQARMALTAARRLYQWAMRYGDSEQQDYAASILECVSSSLLEMGLISADDRAANSPE